jgi:hypothetical protein
MLPLPLYRHCLAPVESHFTVDPVPRPTARRYKGPRQAEDYHLDHDLPWYRQHQYEQVCSRERVTPGRPVSQEVSYCVLWHRRGIATVTCAETERYVCI